MTHKSRSARRQAWRWRAVLFGLVLLALSGAFEAAEAQAGFTIDLIEIYIKAGASPAREWKRDIEKNGIDFEMTVPTQARLRGVGADDDWIAMLLRAPFRPSVAASPPTRQSRQQSASQESPAVSSQRAYSRNELWPMYYDRGGYVTTYVAMSQLRESGGQVGGEVMNTRYGPIPLRSTPLSSSALSYGLTVGMAANGGALLLEGSFQHNLLMLKMGAAYEPFIPLGTSGFRAILGVSPFLGMTRQIIGQVPRAAGDTASADIELHNSTYGADARAGMAYHFRAGRWIYAEWVYRYEATYGRDIRVPGDNTITGKIPWSNWGARGGMLRLGLGW